MTPRGTVRDHVEIVEEDADHLPEPERHDREVVAAQPEGGRPEEHPEEGGQERRQRQDQPEGDVEPELRRGQERVGVGPDGVERHVPQVEEPRVADDDVQPEGQQDVDAGLVEDPEHVPLARLEEGERHHRADHGHDLAEVERQRGEHQEQDDLLRQAPPRDGAERHAHRPVERGHRRRPAGLVIARPARPGFPWAGRRARGSG